MVRLASVVVSGRLGQGGAAWSKEVAGERAGCHSGRGGRKGGARVRRREGREKERKKMRILGEILIL